MSRSRGTLAARRISKSYGGTVVLDGLSLSVTPASRIGVVGPNGIGKSTLLRLLAGAEQPDAGSVTHDPSGLAVSYLVQERSVNGLSGGEAARRNLEAILASDADVLLLDEPTNDLDVDTLRALEEALLDYPGCVVVISHDRWFLDRIATHILAFEGDSHAEWFAGNFEEYEADKKRRLGADADQPHRIKYRKLTR
jgi:sulfate-transporting ATPase